MSGKRQVEARWGVPFWKLVGDFAEQGLSRFDTARALGYRPDSFCTLLSGNPGKDPFDPSDRALGYLRDTGESLSQAVQRMAAQGMLATEIARVIGYRDACGLKRALETRGIEVQFPVRSKAPKRMSIGLGPNVSRGWPTWEQIDRIVQRGAHG